MALIELVTDELPGHASGWEAALGGSRVVTLLEHLKILTEVDRRLYSPVLDLLQLHLPGYCFVSATLTLIMLHLIVFLCQVP